MSIYFQGEIVIRKGRIESLKEFSGGVKIDSDAGESAYFENSTAFPGFADCHGHVAGYGNELGGVPLAGTSSPMECISRLCRLPASAGQWIAARGWNQEEWPGRKYPDCRILDEVFPTAPVYLVRVDGHAAWVNSKAMEIAGISSNTREIDGGAILKFEDGSPTGILIDNAMQLVGDLIPRPGRDKIRKDIISALSRLAESGITETHDMDVFPEHHEAYKELAEENLLPVRVRSYLQAQEGEWEEACPGPFEHGLYHAAGIKLYADGALGSRGAALFEPYSDDPRESGLLLLDAKAIYVKAAAAIERGFEVAIHAIGDRAATECLDAFEAIRRRFGKKPVLRLEHAQNIIESDVARIKGLGVIASVQPVHFYKDAGTMAPSRLGRERLPNAYRWNSLRRKGILLLAGSDYPIESESPLRGIETFVTRLAERGGNEFSADGEALSPEEALEAYCTNPGTVFGESGRGIISAGSPADLCIVSGTPSSDYFRNISREKVMLTMLNGRSTYKAESRLNI